MTARLTPFSLYDEITSVFAVIATLATPTTTHIAPSLFKFFSGFYSNVYHDHRWLLVDYWPWQCLTRRSYLIVSVYYCHRLIISLPYLRLSYRSSTVCFTCKQLLIDCCFKRFCQTLQLSVNSILTVIYRCSRHDCLHIILPLLTVLINYYCNIVLTESLFIVHLLKYSIVSLPFSPLTVLTISRLFLYSYNCNDCCECIVIMSSPSACLLSVTYLQVDQLSVTLCHISVTSTTFLTHSKLRR